MSPEPGTAVAPVPRSREVPGAQPKGGRLAGWLLVAVGAFLLVLTAGQAFAGTVTGGWGEDALRGTDREDRLAGFGGDDDIWGLAGDDVLSGSGGADELYGGEGRDVVVGGAGDDFIEAKDGARDYVECGPGTDIASVDARDLVARGCETVYAG